MGHRSPFPDVHVPAVPVTDYIFEHADSYPDKHAIVDAASGRTLTYGDLYRLVRRMAAGLAAKGFRKGDLLAVYTPPITEYAVLFYGASLAGGAVTPMNPTQMVAELRYQLNDSASRFLVTTPELLEAATRAGCRTAVEHVFVVGEAAGATPLETLLECADSAPGVQIRPEQDVVAVPYSLSGIPGGLPVGVMLTHRNLVASARSVIGRGTYHATRRRADDPRAVAEFWIAFLDEFRAARRRDHRACTLSGRPGGSRRDRPPCGDDRVPGHSAPSHSGSRSSHR